MVRITGSPRQVGPGVLCPVQTEGPTDGPGVGVHQFLQRLFPLYRLGRDVPRTSVDEGSDHEDDVGQLLRCSLL